MLVCVFPEMHVRMSFLFFDTLGAAFHSAADTAATSRGAPTGPLTPRMPGLPQMAFPWQPAATPRRTDARYFVARGLVILRGHSVTPKARPKALVVAGPVRLGGEVGEALGAESDSASKGEPRLREESANPHAVAPRTPAAAVLSVPTSSPRFCAPSPRGAEHVKH